MREEKAMRWSDLVGVAMATLLLLVTPQVASAVTEAEVDCCKFMKKMTDKYLEKHLKLVNKCTSKMNNPKYATVADAILGEKCDNGYDRVLLINNDFAIDKFQQKFLNKMIKKCTKLLGALGLAINGCGCANETQLLSQMECKLGLKAADGDGGVCSIPPLKKNANREPEPPPGFADFCP